MTTKLPDNEIIAAYNGIDAAGKTLLQKLFGSDPFVPKNIIDRVKTADDAFAIKGITIASIVNDDDTVDELAYKILKVIVEVLNEGWVPNWKDSNETKYWPWFDLSSGSGLSFDDCDNAYSLSIVGSRLCFKTRALAEYAAKTFIKEYTDFFIIK